MASAPPDGQLRAAHQATDETLRDRGCGCKGQSSHAGEGKGEWETYMAVKYYHPKLEPDDSPVKYTK